MPSYVRRAYQGGNPPVRRPISDIPLSTPAKLLSSLFSLLGSLGGKKMS
jgi:hypothetical protein